MAATGLSDVTPASRPATAAGNDGSSNCTTTGVSSRRDTDARCAATPSASEAARSCNAPGSVIARCPLDSSSSAASVIGPGACTLTGRPLPRSPASSQASSSASMSSASRLADRRVTAPGRADQPVAARHGVDGDVDQQRAGAPDDVGAHSPGGQLDQMGHRGAQLADDDFGCRPRGRTGP